jgi:3-hydroxy-9,10-secoandrosta-1,3,5(10)-triene-9,17-dione monooxygenase
MNADTRAQTLALHATLVQRARDLAPALRERSARTCADRRVPAETGAALRAAGLTRVLQPARYGGFEASYLLFTDIIHELAQGCASTSWIYGVLGEHQWVLSHYPLAAQDAFWADPTAVSCASFNPTGRARAVDGGWRVSGRWSYASGCDHAQWAIVGAMVEESAGRQAPWDMVIPIGEFTIDDDWHVLGLAGTGSKTLVADDVFVPRERSMLHDDLKNARTPGQQVHPDYDLVRSPRGPFASFTLLASLVGLAHRAVDSFASHTRERVSRGLRIAEQESMQIKLSESSAEADAARLIMRHTLQDNAASLAAREPLGLERLTRTRRDVAYAARLSMQAVERLFIASGSRAIYAGSDMELIFRDTHAAGSHFFLNWELGARPHGQQLMGLPIDSPLM